MFYRQYPVDGQFERLPDGQEVDEDPDESSDEADDGDEQKPVCARKNDGRGAGHAHDAKHLATDKKTQTINKLHFTFQSRRSRTSMSGISTARDDPFNGAATQSIAFAMYAMFAMHGKNSCLYGQRKGPHKTAYAMFAMLAM